MKWIEPVKCENADGDVFSVTEANTRESTNGKIPEGLSGLVVQQS